MDKINRASVNCELTSDGLLYVQLVCLKKREGKQASKPPLSLERHLKSPSSRLMEVGETLRLCALGLTHEGGRKPEV